MRFSHETGDRRFSRGGMYEKMSCLMRKSHFLSVLGPPKSENLLCPVSWENLMSQEKISCRFSFVPHPHEKISCLLSQEKISCLKRKSHVFSVLAPQRENLLSPVSRENLMSYQFGAPSTRKSPVSYLRRKFHVSRENIISYQFWPPPNEKMSCLLFHKKISCLKRKSHVLSVLGPHPQRENLMSSVS